MMMWEYFIVLGAIVFFPIILSFDQKLGFYRQRRVIALSTLGMCVPFWIWDIVATARGHWWFNPNHIVGVAFAGMPVEEWLFFPVVGFVSLFTWESTKYFWGRRKT